MRSTVRSRVGALLVFLLLSGFVVGTMAWATRARMALATELVRRQYAGRISRAVDQLGIYMGGILNSESARQFRDYLRYHVEHPEIVLSRRGAEVDAEWALVKSPLAVSGPPYAWIDLYFNLDPEGHLSSPQVRENAPFQAFENPTEFDHVEAQALPTWEWLKTTLSPQEIRRKVAAVCQADSVASNTKKTSSAADPATMDPTQERIQAIREAQQRYLPAWACIPHDVAEQTVSTEILGGAAGTERLLDQGGGEVTVAVDPLIPFWLDDDSSHPRKLAFVREAHVGETSFYQGFIGDWDRLKPELLRRIQDEFPEADLIPVTSDEGISEWQVINLPVRLQVPEIPGGAARVAWRQVRGPLITMWAAGAAVLVVAGFGLWNLVSLMERRMQFAYGVTHELRTPLTTFRLYSDMLSAGLVPESARQEYLDTLNRESIRLASLVEDVLEYARLESNKVRLSVTETDGPSLLATIEETLVERCRKNGVRPQTENAVLNGEPIRTDVDLVHRIATVLVDNGVRHARGREDAVVLVRLRADHDHLLLDVIDSGPGIDRRDARTIFKPFRRGRNSETSAQGGIGLGLALARSWAQLLGGRLELVARRHEHYGGAHFRLIIPSHPRTAS